MATKFEKFIIKFIVWFFWRVADTLCILGIVLFLYFGLFKHSWKYIILGIICPFVAYGIVEIIGKIREYLLGHMDIDFDELK